mgnify:CR=1 FL=1
MAGGKITRIVKGVNSIECDSWTVYTDKFTAYANNGSHFTADGGTNFGEPKDPPPVGKYFVKGWWTDENDKTIKEATIGNKVKFHLQMQNIPKDDDKRQVKMELRDFEEFSLLYYILGIETDKFKGYDEISIKAYDENKNVYSKEYWDIDSSNKIVIKLNLDGDSLIKMLAKEHDRNLELYFRCSYINPENYIEVLHFPEMESDYLKVNPPPIVEPIIFVHATREHLLPAVYSSDDGSPWYIAVKNAGSDITKGYLYGKKISKLLEPNDELASLEKKAYEVAVRKLKKGDLVFNTGRKGTTSRFHEYSVSDIDGKFQEKVLMGVNRGSGISGETTKGINQLEAQSQLGIAKAYRTVGDIMGIFGTLTDLASMLTAVGRQELPPVPMMPPFITMEVEKMMAENDEFIIKHWNIELQKSIGQGKAVTKRFLETNNINIEKNLRFQVIDLTEEGLTKILNKEISSINDKEDPNSPKMIESLSNIGYGNHDLGILIQSMDAEDIFKRATTNHYIHAIFVNELNA